MPLKSSDEYQPSVLQVNISRGRVGLILGVIALLGQAYIMWQLYEPGATTDKGRALDSVLALIVGVPVCLFFAMTSWIGSLVRSERVGEGSAGLVFAMLAASLYCVSVLM